MAKDGRNWEGRCKELDEGELERGQCEVEKRVAWQEAVRLEVASQRRRSHRQ